MGGEVSPKMVLDHTHIPFTIIQGKVLLVFKYSLATSLPLPLSGRRVVKN